MECSDCGIDVSNEAKFQIFNYAKLIKIYCEECVRPHKLVLEAMDQNKPSKVTKYWAIRSIDKLELIFDINSMEI